MVGGTVATLVLVAGLLWPTGGSDGPAAAQIPMTEEDGPPSPRPDSGTGRDGVERRDGAEATTPSEGAQPGPGDEGPTGPATSLLAALAACRQAGDDVCSSAVAVDAAPGVVAELADSSPDDGVELLDSYGDVAVMRLIGAVDGERRILVLARQDGEWLVRNVYDVADQPS